jgi:hypothetical protein
MFRCISRSGILFEQVSVKNLLSAMLVSSFVMCLFVEELCAENICSILMTVIKRVR